MRRSAVVLVLLLAMLWQAIALARPGSTVNLLADLQHAVLHWQAEAHHHHDDGSYHLDDSDAATVHVLMDHATVSAALLPSIADRVPPGAAPRPGGLLDTPVPDPVLDSLLRPPRRHA